MSSLLQDELLGPTKAPPDKSSQEKQSILHILADERRFWPWAALAVAIVSLMKGLRLPSRWAATAALTDYSHGLLKRGLFGATLGRWMHLEHYSNFVIVSYFLLFAMLGLLVALILQSGVLQTIESGVPVALFGASIAVTFLGHLVGYPDIQVAILALALLLVRQTMLRAALAVPVCIVALLVHELFLLVFLPLLLLTFLVDAARQPPWRRKPYWATATVLLVMCVGVTLKLALKAPATTQASESLRQEIQRRADFKLREDYFQVLNWSSADNVKTMAKLWTQPPYQTAVVGTVITLLPTMALLLYAVWRSVARLARGRQGMLLAGAATVAALSPLTMNMLGFDVGRFNSLACFDCLLVLLVVCPRAGETPIALPAWYRNAAILAIAVSMASGEELMDHKTIRPYPFSIGARHEVTSVLHRHWDPPPL